VLELTTISEGAMAWFPLLPGRPIILTKAVEQLQCEGVKTFTRPHDTAAREPVKTVAPVVFAARTASKIELRG